MRTLTVWADDRPTAVSGRGTLVVGPSWVGDMVMAQALFKLLKQRNPHAPLDVLAPGWSLPIIARMPEIRQGLTSPGAHGEVGLGRRWRLGRSLRDAGYGQAIVLPRSFKAALVPWFAGIPVRTGFRGEARFRLINDIRAFDGQILDQTVKRYLALGIAPGEPLPQLQNPALAVSSERQRLLVERLALSAGRPVIALMPGAEYGPAKCWPLEYFSSLGTLLVEHGYTVWVFGSARDAAAGHAIAKVSGAVNLCGQTQLADVIDLLALCEQAVTNDSGLMHVAAAVGTRVVALYGSTSPGFTPPLTDNRVVHYLGIACSPCFKRRCPLKHFRCLRDILPADVLASILVGRENGEIRRERT